MSLAQASLYNPAAAFNPFGPSATLGSDQIFIRASPGLPTITATSEETPLHAPQGRVPTNVSSLAPPVSLSRPESRPDFSRGFGVDIPEEEEPPEDEPVEVAVEVEISNDESEIALAVENVSQEEDMVIDTDGEDLLVDDISTAAQSRIHSRHVSKLSAALSLRSVGRVEEHATLPVPSIPEVASVRDPATEDEVDDIDGDAIEEWTGSEDMRTSDDEVRDTTFQNKEPDSQYCFRALASGRTLPTKNEHASTAFIAACCGEPDKCIAISRRQGGFQTSLVRRSRLYQDIRTMTLYPTPAMKSMKN